MWFNGKRMERTTLAASQRIPDITSLLSFSTTLELGLFGQTLRKANNHYISSRDGICVFIHKLSFSVFCFTCAVPKIKTTASASCWWLIIHRTHISTRLRNKWIRINEFWCAHETYKIPPRHTARWHGLLGIQWSTRLYFFVHFVVVVVDIV